MPRRIPSACLALVLRGIFLCRQSEIDWFLYGMRTVFPGGVAQLSPAIIPEAERDDLLDAYYRRLTDPNPARAYAGGARLEHL